MDYFELKIGNLTRKLPKIEISDDLTIASFVILGDVELVTESSRLLKEKIPRVDYLVTAEAKGIPLVHELSRQMGLSRYIVVRKSVKAYMNEPISTPVQSITTKEIQNLFLNDNDFELIEGKRVAIVDDVISTGGSVEAIEKLMEQAGASVVAKVAILAEGEAAKRTDIIFLEELPLF